MSYPARLLKAQREGAAIVCSLAPYEGRPVEYRPRRQHDAQPWVLGRFRYRGQECHAVSGE